MAGYSGTPLYKKLGIKEESTLYLINPPNNYIQLVDAPFPIHFLFQPSSPNIIHTFTKSHSEIKVQLPKLKKLMTEKGMIWVSWPKKTSNVESDLDENKIRDLALSIGLVDVKVCAVDETWSGLKLVTRKK